MMQLLLELPHLDLLCLQNQCVANREDPNEASPIGAASSGPSMFAKFMKYTLPGLVML